MVAAAPAPRTAAVLEDREGTAEQPAVRAARSVAPEVTAEARVAAEKEVPEAVALLEVAETQEPTVG